MNRKRLPWLLLFLLWLPVCAVADSFSGRVIRVADGDTITVLATDGQRQKIRLNGIDAPELGQDFGQAARRHLANLVLERNVTVSWRKVDRYNRLVAKVSIGDLNVNFEQLRAGMAWYFKKYISDVSPEDRPVYENAETEARAARRGLWKQSNPTPPWDYRAGMDQIDAETTSEDLPVIGNRNSKVYHEPKCPDYQKVSPRNRIEFPTAQDAEHAGFRRAGNCRSPE